MELAEKLRILAEGAKYDVSCSSSGSDRGAKKGQLGNAALPGICHSWSDDGRCVSLLKILYSNDCVYDCAYCVNSRSADVERATFTPEELVRLTIGFYRRNYIEGLFISSAVTVSPDHTMERLIEVVRKLREEERFNGYIHLKGIPGADLRLLDLAGRYVDRMSINLEVPSARGLKLLAPQKSQESILRPMHYLKNQIAESRETQLALRTQPRFVPAGQTTQFMIGATQENDRSIVRVSEALYQQYALKRVYYSAYVPVIQNNPLLPKDVKSPLLREHRLYQADWLLRFYGFNAEEILPKEEPNLDPMLDPKCQWAIRNLNQFPVEVNRADYEMLLRVPGIGVVTARRIVASRRFARLGYEDLKKLGVVLKRARYFILCNGKYHGDGAMEPLLIRDRMVRQELPALPEKPRQLDLFDLLPLETMKSPESPESLLPEVFGNGWGTALPEAPLLLSAANG